MKVGEQACQFLDASSHLYTRLRMFVGPSVGWSVSPTFAKKVIFSEGYDLKVIYLEGKNLRFMLSVKDWNYLG